MGVQISDIVPRQEIGLEDLQGKVIAVDAFNILYQFLTTIRQPDGTPLKNSKGEITSHLSGLFYRNLNLLKAGLRLVYVFDGKPPELKSKERQKRSEAKESAREKYEAAKKEEDVEGMRKYSSQTVKINDKIIEQAKTLLDSMGIPCIVAPGEGEAEACDLVKKKKVWAAGSQDYDVLLFGAPRLIRNLTLARKRKTAYGSYVPVEIELIDFDNVLNKLQIDKEQLICLGILVGTDFNPGGVKGVGQKRALEIVQKYKYPVKIFEYIEYSEKYELDFDWQEIFKEFNDFEVSNADFEFKEPDFSRLKEFLLENDFSENRIDSGIEKLKKIKEEKKQKGLGDFL